MMFGPADAQVGYQLREIRREVAGCRRAAPARDRAAEGPRAGRRPSSLRRRVAFTLIEAGLRLLPAAVEPVRR